MGGQELPRGGSRWPGAGQGSPGLWGTKGAMAWGYSWVGIKGQAMDYSGTDVAQDDAAFEVFWISHASIGIKK